MRSEQSEYTVPWRTTEYVDVAARARELGCDVPSGVALLPGNFVSAAGRAELRYHEVASQVREAWRGVGLVDSGPGRKLRPKGAASDNSDQDIPLAVFFGMDLPNAPARPVLDALSMVASVLTVNPRVARTRDVRVDAIVERPNCGGYVCLKYSGSVRELVTLAGPIREIHDGGPTAGSTSRGTARSGQSKGSTCNPGQEKTGSESDWAAPENTAGNKKRIGARAQSKEGGAGW